MSADAIRDLRHVIAELRTRGEAGLADMAVEATDALVAEHEQMRAALASLPPELLAALEINPRDLVRVHVSKEHPEPTL